MVLTAVRCGVQRRRWRWAAVRRISAKGGKCPARAISGMLARFVLAAVFTALALGAAASRITVERVDEVRELEGPAAVRGDVRRGVRLRLEDGSVSIFSVEEYGTAASD